MFKNSSSIIFTSTAIGHMLVHSITLIYPAIMIVIKNEFQVSLVVLGQLGTIQFLLFGLAAFPAGYLVDKIGSKNVLGIYFIGISLSVVIISLAKTLIVIAIGLGTLGMFAGLYHPAGLNLISNSTNVSRYMGYHGISGSVGLTLGPLIGGSIAGFTDWRFAFILLGCISLLGAIFVFKYLPADRPQKSAEILKNGPIIEPVHIVIFAVSALWGFAHHGIFNFMPIYFSESVILNLDPVTSGGLLTAFVLLIGTFGQIIGGRLGEKIPRQKLLIWVIALNIPFMLIMGISSGLILIIAAGFLGAVNFTYQPVNNSLIADMTIKRNRGLVYGISSGLGFGVGSFSMMAGGYIGEYFSIQYIFPLLTIVLIPAVFLSLWIYNKKIQTNT
ncbi:MAG: MFS transporter [Candidatus Marinimicrobia bacterium]|jgi:MFS transporter, FSR family, fosmidomycin resistance protein|nr:MFS transporter [Candidatus Neomarinimicrobiota bacterium]MBT3634148.1 MFS transporter [Candidatus Neomarinimicrobiota bacterium]MBT3683185.1 MFS transporter [Candidatus Neomarinimicrobiota bacterium]MBT3759767.1 MFS transporter [Candidatus Neomarinimicrobiota bacterium]MBT3895827.1 MFS transporter [Candidatus Neomarinimicrobiota bacterium]